jgi:hypothetical protein
MVRKSSKKNVSKNNKLENAKKVLSQKMVVESKKGKKTSYVDIFSAIKKSNNTRMVRHLRRNNKKSTVFVKSNKNKGYDVTVSKNNEKVKKMKVTSASMIKKLLKNQRHNLNKNSKSSNKNITNNNGNVNNINNNNLNNGNVNNINNNNLNNGNVNNINNNNVNKSRKTKTMKKMKSKLSNKKQGNNIISKSKRSPFKKHQFKRKFSKKSRKNRRRGKKGTSKK